MSDFLGLFIGGAIVAIVFAGIATIFAPRMAPRAPAPTVRVVMWSYLPMWISLSGLGNVLANGDQQFAPGTGMLVGVGVLVVALGLYWLAGLVPVVRRHRAIMAEAYGAKPSLLVDTGGYRAPTVVGEGHNK